MMRLLEWLLGLDAGFLRRAGDLSISFAPRWPFPNQVGAFTWNVILLAACAAIVFFTYRREARTLAARRWLGGLRSALLLLIVALLNRPQLTLTQSRVEPSVLAVMIDDSMSMRLSDVPAGATSQPAADAPTISRLAAVQSALSATQDELVRRLAKVHQLRFYHFSNDALALDGASSETSASPELVKSIASLEATGGQTRVIGSLETVARELQGQRIAGLVVLTDGRETEAKAAEALPQLRELGVKVFPVPVGTETGLRNVEVESIAVQDSVFAGDVVNVKVAVRATGVPPGSAVRLVLKDSSGTPIVEDGKPVELDVIFDGGEGVQNVELQFVPQNKGTLDVTVEAIPLSGEIDDADNSRVAQLAVLDANLRVLYVEGYPRWEYRYLKQELIRDASIDVSCLLFSADATFAQEGDLPITRFPDTMEELTEYDVVVIGDVDPRQFTDNQLQLLNEFVSRRGGGFGMISGPQFAPQAYRNSAVEPLLPVDITRVETDSVANAQNFAEGFRPILTEDGRGSSIFRFYRDAVVNADFIANKIQPIFWYCRGTTVKPGVGETLAQHPRKTAADGRPAPLVVVGRFGAGRTLFSGIDDSWRWRYYTGEQAFNGYWVQTLRYLARGKKLGQRKLTFTSERPAYQLGEAARLSVRALDPQLLTQLPDELRVQVIDNKGQVVRDASLLRRGAQGDAFTGGFTADRVGRYTVRLSSPAAGVEDITVPLEVTVPRVELNDPKLDRVSLTRVAEATGGKVIEFADVSKLPELIPSAEKDIPLISRSLLSTAPLALLVFTALITAEWILRKRQGLV